jgi:competence protein ComEA
VFAAAIAALGMVARVVRARDTRPEPTPPAVRALDAQIALVDSARRSASRGTRNTPRGAGASPKGGRGGGSTPAVREPILVDADVADAAALERLPWIGPALAARIVENRGRCGPFGSIEALTRVNGIGAASVKRLAPHVTFSGRSSPTGASPTQGCPGAVRGAAPSRRGRP